MPQPAPSSGLVRISSASVLSALLASVATAQGPVFLSGTHGHGDLVRRAMPGATSAEVLRALFGGPSDQERSRGWSTAIPREARFLGSEPWRAPSGRAGLRVLVSPAFAEGPLVESAIEQVAKSLSAHVRDTSVVVLRADRSRVDIRELLTPRDALGQRTPPPPAKPSSVQGALSGKRIAVSPGHGFYWHPSLGWTTQRPLIGGLIEDIHTNEIAMRYLVRYLENLGAEVISCRDIGEMPAEHVCDDDQPFSGYSETGAWSRSSSTGYAGRGYRFATTKAQADAVATWVYRVPRSGYYPIHAFYRASGNRSADARFRVTHASGSETVLVDQTRNDRVWVQLGTWWFEQGQTARVELDNASSAPGRVVIADAVRFGNGLGDLVRGSSSSGKLRWQECSRYWAQTQGAPSSIWDSSSGNDHTDDVTCRPRYAEWRGADCYISLHTNAGGGSGTSSYIHSTSPTPGSSALQNAVQAQIVADVRAEYDATWTNRGKYSANFGELRLLSSMPGVLVELAFHDQNGSKDHNALHDPDFRRIGARAYARGVLRYFSSTAAFAPTRPTALRVIGEGGGFRVAWDTVSFATEYSVEVSVDGKNFVEAARTAAAQWSSGAFPHGTVRSFRVRAWNASGRSFPSEVLTAGNSHAHRSELLLVAGFDRLGKTVKGPENTRDYLRQHGDAIRRHGAWSLGFDATSNEAIVSGRVRLGDYRAVVWAAGEESTVDESFGAREQQLVQAYLAGGGRMLISGSEIGWDLDAKGSAADRQFFRSVLGVSYIRDDAGTYSFRAGTSGLFAGLGSGSFDDGSGTTYDVDYPDVLAPADASGQSVLFYGSGSDAAAIAVDRGASRVVFFGFPLEAVRSDVLRADLVERSLRFLLTGRSFEAPLSVAVGGRASLPLRVPGEPGSVYVLAASAGTQPGLALPDGRVLPFVADALFAASLGANHPVFDRWAGLLDASGQATPTLGVPMMASLRGLRLYVSGLTLGAQAPFGASTVLPWFRIDVR